ncbi:hypothetical protein JVT61DRAFT_9040 [Boletus reticuloceps]|uniref:phytol kinase n=1 Tax=Boletus reticuloceps TaxID=495285 RepID=A0A8I2YGS5_9AGAM|nr:hypothetical protein JVT61DRAFT_9040 [Boletus reticuloceps]
MRAALERYGREKNTTGPRPKETVREQVRARLSLAVGGTIMQSISASLSKGTLKSAPLLDPPIATGLTESVNKIYDIVLKHGPVSREEWGQLPALFRRVRHLLRVYYDAVFTHRKTVEFKFCDMKDMSDVGLKLHECGLFLQLSPGRLSACLSSAPDLETFIFDDPIDLGRWRLEAAAIEQTVKADPEADDDDRERALELENKSGNDLAAYQLSFFLGDVLVAFLINPANDNKDKARQAKAMGRLVMMSTTPLYQLAFGDALTDAMRPVYWTPTPRCSSGFRMRAACQRWSRTGTLKDGLCKTAMEKLPGKAWAHQTPESLLGIMRGLIRKLEFEGDDFAETPIFVIILHQIYSRYGLEPFERASHLSDFEIIFYFLHRRLSKKPEKFQSAHEWLPLLKKYRNVPGATRKRHGWMILTISGRWDLLAMCGYGCGYAECPETSALLRLKEARVRGTRDPVVEDRLFQWGGASKACARCKAVSYCGAACQKADWKRHKSECAAEAAKNKNEEI